MLMMSHYFIRSPVSRRRKMAALLIAMSVDLLRLVLLPVFFAGVISPWDDMLDITTAATLFFVLGPRWQLAMGLLIELIPVIETFPVWTLMVLSLPTANPESSPISHGISADKIDSSHYSRRTSCPSGF